MNSLIIRNLFKNFKTNKFFNNRNLIQSNNINKLQYSTNVLIESEDYIDLVKTHTNPNLSHSFSLSHFPLLSDTIGHLISERGKRLSDKMVFAFPHQGSKLTFGELDQRVNAFSQNLLELGFKKGDRIALVLPNTHELVVAFLASAKIGLISVVLNPAYQIVELEHMLKKSGAKGLVIYDSFKTLQHLELIKKLCPELESSSAGELNSKNLPNLKHVVVLNSPLIPEKKSYKGTWRFENLSETKSRASSHELPYVEIDDPCLILFTSGTTGKPKGALMSHHNLVNCAYLSTAIVANSKGLTIVCNPIPLFHIFGLSTGLMIPLVFGSAKVFPFYFPETVTTMKAIQDYKCVTLRGTPTQFYDIINHPLRNKFDLSSLENAILGGSTVPKDLLHQLKNEMNIKSIIVGYGMTETSLAHSVTTYSDEKKSLKHAFESIGRQLPYTETKIVDPKTGQILPHNTDGELHLRGYHVFKGYWEEPEKTAETIDKNGWLRTGDICSMDSEGYLYFKTREKDLIIRGGANIYPAEIEDYLRTNPNILDASAFGVPDERVGEEVCVWIKLKPNVTFTESQVKEFCKGNISQFKIPRYVKFVESFPINANNKILKNKMRELAIKEYKL